MINLKQKSIKNRLSHGRLGLFLMVRFGIVNIQPLFMIIRQKALLFDEIQLILTFSVFTRPFYFVFLACLVVKTPLVG